MATNQPVSSKGFLTPTFGPIPGPFPKEKVERGGTNAHKDIDIPEKVL